MKTQLLLTAAALVSSGYCMAQDVGRVLSSTPIVQQVGDPRQACSTEQVEVQRQSSGAGAVLGAIAGSAIGNASGHGGERGAATVIGAIGGAIVGNAIEGQPQSQIRDEQRCATQTYYENRTVAYNVVYEFAGKQYSVHMPQDPGPTIQLQVSPVGALAQSPSKGYRNGQLQPVYSQPPVIESESYYQPYYQRPYYPPVTVELGDGYWGGGYRGHGHWR